jgi:hypothetical protein
MTELNESLSVPFAGGCFHRPEANLNSKNEVVKFLLRHGRFFFGEADYLEMRGNFHSDQADIVGKWRASGEYAHLLQKSIE